MAEAKKTETKKTEKKEEIKKTPHTLMQKIVAMKNEISVGRDAKNEHKSYDYFSPDAINNAVNPLLEKYNVNDHFDMRYNNDIGMYRAVYTLFNLDREGDSIQYVLDIPVADIAGANGAQRAGGTMTYGKRYSQMNAFNIADPKDDLDHDRNTKKTSSSTGKKTTTSKPSSPKKNFKKADKQPTTKTDGSSGSKSTKKTTTSKSGSDANKPSAPQLKYLEVLKKKGSIPEEVDLDTLTKQEASTTISEAKEGKDLSILAKTDLPDVDTEDSQVDVDELVDDE